MPGTKLFVISGPSGVGKDTIINHLKSRGRDWYFVTTATTRSIRDGEKDGKDYLFLTHDQFQAMLDRDQFIENAEVYGNRYGVPISQIDIAKYTNRHAILKIDGSGGEYLKMIAGGSLNPATVNTVKMGQHYIYQDGKTVFKFAVTKMADVSAEIMQKNNLKGEI